MEASEPRIRSALDLMELASKYSGCALIASFGFSFTFSRLSPHPASNTTVEASTIPFNSYMFDHEYFNIKSQSEC
jgi:hypothetical protein